MQLKNILAFGTLLAAGGLAHADAVAPFTVNFESLGTNTACINGGSLDSNCAGSQGSYGNLLFSANALTVGSVLGSPSGDGNFTSDGSDNIALTFVPGTGVSLSFTLADGNYFTSQFAMDFVGVFGSGTLDLRDADGVSLLSSPAPFVTSQVACQTPGVVCDWQTDTVAFSGDATTVVLTFASESDEFFFNNLSFGASAASAPSGNTVPEPTGTALTMAALGALALVRRRSSK